MVIVLDIAKRAGAQQLGVAVSEAQAADTAPIDLPKATP